MKKTLLFVLFLLLYGTMGICQTIATDFTANDCFGKVHHLFDELDSGKIIVVAFVMPCDACVAPSLSASSVVAGYVTSNPGKVVFYIADDPANATCSSLTSWASSHGMFGEPTFSDVSFKESDYGTVTMPKIVAIAGTGHYVIYSEDNSLTTSNLQAAINSALAGTLNTPVPRKEDFELNLFPNPAINNISINYTIRTSAFVSIDILNIFGSKIKTITEEQTAGQHKTNFNFEGTLSTGIYFLKLNAGGVYKMVTFNVVN